MTFAALVFALVGLASIGGGWMGFKKAGSRASLIAGGIAGIILLVACGALLRGAATWGLALGGATSALLAGRFLPAYLRTKKAMPHGMMAGLSVLGAVAGALGLFYG